jgi:hypothetical protein
MPTNTPLTEELLLEALTDFRLSLEKRLDQFATKEDLKQFATKQDLQDFATSILDGVVDALDERYVTKDEHQKLVKQVQYLTS